MKPFVAGQIRAFDPQQIFDGAGDIVAFHHFGRSLHGALKRLLRLLRVFAQADTDIGDKAHPHRLAVQHGLVAGDDSGALQILHPAQTSRGRQAHTLSQLQVADPPVAGQFLQYLLIYAIIFSH